MACRKLRSLYGQSSGGYAHWCPACKNMHVFRTRSEGENAVWKFDGNLDSPTFSPSMRIRWKENEVEKICHYFLTAGKISFCGDSTHEMAGQVVDLPDLPDWMDR